MENAIEALKMAIAMMMFVVALTLSISSFSQATSAVRSITIMRDKEREYTYVKPSENLTRTVGIETVISTMYRAFEENIEIHFMKENGTEISLYKKIDSNQIETDVTCIDLKNEGFKNAKEAQEHLDIILGGDDVLNTKKDSIQQKYTTDIKMIYNQGLYKEFKNKKFEELLGEYYQGEGTSQIKKRVITYILKNI